VSNQKIAGYLTSSKPELSPAGLRAHMNSFSATMNYAARMGWVSSDRIPKLQRHNPIARRPAFSVEDYKTFYRANARWTDDTNVTLKECKVRHQFRDWFLIMANTGMRLGEARLLRWRDIEFFDDEEGQRQVIFYISPHGKTGAREAVGMPRTVVYLERLKSIYETVWNFEPGPSDYVFCGLNREPRKSWKKIWMKAKANSGVHRDNHGAPYTIYSLRHFFITMRLRENVNIYKLARSVGTSVAMIEKHYGHLIPRDSVRELTKVS
jgi:integrase